MLKDRGVRTVRLTNAMTKQPDLCENVVANALKGIVQAERQTQKPTISSLSREDELVMQDEWLKHNKVTVCYKRI